MAEADGLGAALLSALLWVCCVGAAWGACSLTHPPHTHTHTSTSQTMGNLRTDIHEERLYERVCVCVLRLKSRHSTHRNLSLPRSIKKRTSHFTIFAFLRTHPTAISGPPPTAQLKNQEKERARNDYALRPGWRNGTITTAFRLEPGGPHVRKPSPDSPAVFREKESARKRRGVGRPFRQVGSGTRLLFAFSLASREQGSWIGGLLPTPPLPCRVTLACDGGLR